MFLGGWGDLPQDEWEGFSDSVCGMNAISGGGEKKEHSSSEQKVERHRDSCWKCRSQFHEVISGWVKTKFCTELHSVWNIKWYSCLLCSHFSRDIHSCLSIIHETVYSCKTGKKLRIISPPKKPKTKLERWINLPKLTKQNTNNNKKHQQCSEIKHVQIPNNSLLDHASVRHRVWI